MISELFPPIPADTASAARSVFGRSNFYIATGDQANNLFSGLVLEDPRGWHGKSTRGLAELYLISIFQYIETLPDNPAAEALRVRVDWKYALHLPLNSLGMDGELLCDFRRWLLAQHSREENLQILLSRLVEVLEFSSKRNAFLESRQLVMTVCGYSRLAKIWETMCQAIEGLAVQQPAWLRKVNLPHWYERYGRHRKKINLAAAGAEQIALAGSIGADGLHLLKAISEEGDESRSNLPEIQILQEVWEVQFKLDKEGVTWRKDACADCLSPIRRTGFIFSTEQVDKKGGRH